MHSLQCYCQHWCRDITKCKSLHHPWWLRYILVRSPLLVPCTRSPHEQFQLVCRHAAQWIEDVEFALDSSTICNGYMTERSCGCLFISVHQNTFPISSMVAAYAPLVFLDVLLRFGLPPLPITLQTRLCTCIKHDLVLKMPAPLHYQSCVVLKLTPFYAPGPKTFSVAQCFLMHSSFAFWLLFTLSQVSHLVALLSYENPLCSSSFIGNNGWIGIVLLPW